jgi:hypothetical protein
MFKVCFVPDFCETSRHVYLIADLNVYDFLLHASTTKSSLRPLR